MQALHLYKIKHFFVLLEYAARSALKSEYSKRICNARKVLDDHCEMLKKRNQPEEIWRFLVAIQTKFDVMEAKYFLCKETHDLNPKYEWLMKSSDECEMRAIVTELKMKYSVINKDRD